MAAERMRLEGELRCERADSTAKLEETRQRAAADVERSRAEAEAAKARA